MPQIVTAPDGSQHSFPDEATPAQMQEAMRSLVDPVAKLGERVSGLKSSFVQVPRDIERGMQDIPDAGAQFMTRLFEQLTPTGSPIEQWAIEQRRKVENINRQGEQSYLDERGPGFKGGRMMGNALGIAPAAYAIPSLGTSVPAVMGQGAAQGGLGGLFQPVERNPNDYSPPLPDAPEPELTNKDYWKTKAAQVVLGAGLGGIFSGVGEIVSRLINPKAAQGDVAKLVEQGVYPTPGRVIGGAARTVEDASTSIPFYGDVVKGGQRRAVEQFNRASVNQVLDPIGEKLPGNVMTGTDSVDYAHRAVSAAYDKLVPSLTARADQQFLSDMGNLRSLAGNMVKERADQFEKILVDKALRKISPNGTITGESLKEIESELGRLAKDGLKSPDMDQRMLGAALREAQATFRDLIARSHPDLAPQLSANNEAWAKLVRIETAASRQGAMNRGGVFSPSELMSSVRQTDQSLRKTATARGDALLQDWARAGTNVLGPGIPDSGTPLRAIVSAGMIGGPAAAAAVLHPSLAILGAPALSYTSPAQALLATLLASRGPGAGVAADQLRELLPLLAAGGAGLSRQTPSQGQ